MHRRRRTEDQEEDRLMNGESRLIVEDREEMRRPRRMEDREDTCLLRHREDREGQEEICSRQTEEYRPAVRGITKGEI